MKTEKSTRLTRKAQWLRGLQTLISTGVSTAQALDKVSAGLPADEARALARAGRGVAGGSGLGRALARAGLLTSWQSRLLSAGEQAGTTETVLEWLADHDEKRARSRQQLRSSAVYPLVLMGLATVLAPLPALMRGDVSVTGMVLSMALQLFGLYAAFRWGIDALYRERDYRFPALAIKLLPYWPALRRRFETAWLQVLALLLDTGLDAQRALALMQSCHHPELARAHEQARERVAGGQSLARALLDAGLVTSPRARETLFSGEQAGRLAYALQHYARRESELAAIGEWEVWAGRALYGLALLWIGFKLGTGSGLMALYP